jgi:phospholipase/carboxylesterase
METAELSMPHLVRPPGLALRKPPLLILLHGAGGSEKELFEAVSLLDERFIVVTVRAPFMQSPRHYEWFGAEWLGGQRMMNLMQADFSRKSLEKFIPEAVHAYKANANRVYLLGFDQGATMALSLLLTDPELLAGVVAIAGQLPEEMRALMVKPDQLKGIPVLIVHGIQDQVLPLSAAEAIKTTLEGYRMEVSYLETPNTHELTAEMVDEANTWLTGRLETLQVEGEPIPPPYLTRLGHLQLRVRNLERSVRFYTQYLGMKVTERTGKTYVFLSSDSKHHELALQKIGPNAYIPRANTIGMQSIGFEVRDKIDFALAYQSLVESGIEVTATDHMVRWSLYFNDPDGNEVEIYCDARHWPGKSDYWQGRDLPLEAQTILAALKEH